MKKIGFGSWIGIVIREGRTWRFLGAALLILVVVMGAVVLMWGYDGLKKAAMETDKFGLFLAGLNLVAVGLLGFYQRWQAWQEERPKFLTTVVELPGDDSQIVLLLPFTPLTGPGDLRAQAQAALQSWNENRHLPIEQMLYEVKALGVFQDPEKKLNKGMPFSQHVVRIKWGEPSEKQEKDLLVQWVESVRGSGRAFLLLHRHAALDLPSQWMRCLISQDIAKAWLSQPQPLKVEDCEAWEKQSKKGGDIQCEHLWLVSRHTGTIEWVKARCGNIERILEHLGDEALVQLREAVNRTAEPFCVMGNLPPRLIAEVERAGARYVHIELDVPSSMRGKELPTDALRHYEPALMAYTARRIDKKVVCADA